MPEMLRPTFLLALAALACAPGSDDAATAAPAKQTGAPEPGASPLILAYDPARAPGTYMLTFVLDAGELHSDGGIGFELRPRSDTRFDLFVTRLNDGTGDIEDPRLSEHPVHDLSVGARTR